MKTRLFVQFFLLTAVAGCVTPSTMMVNREGKVVRCASYGYGNLPAMMMADQLHDNCVRDARLVGFIPIPTAQMGIHADGNPMTVKQVAGPAKAAGVREGDILLELDSQTVGSTFSVIEFLNTKKPGDRVNVKVRRGEEILVHTVELIAR